MDSVVASNIFTKGWSLDNETKNKLNEMEALPRILDKEPKPFKIHNTKDRTQLEILFFDAVEKFSTTTIKNASLWYDVDEVHLKINIQPKVLTLLRVLYVMSLSPVQELAVRSATLLVQTCSLLTPTTSINVTSLALMMEDRLAQNDLRDLACRWLRC